MSHSKLLTAPEAAQWLAKTVTGALHTNSRNLKSGDAFIALPGHNTDGRNYITAALAAGASACLVEANDVAQFGFDDARIAWVADLKRHLGFIAHTFYGEPSSHLKIIASTGTNGKTSTAWWMAQALSKLNIPCGVIGTLGVGAPGSTISTGLTTPDAVTMHHTLRSFADAGYAACALEASSIGLIEQRLNGVEIDVALFTNFTQDHLDYHGSMAHYWDAKRILFSWPSLKAAVLNIDDAKGEQLQSELANSTLDLWSVSTSRPARLQAKNIVYTNSGMTFAVVEDNKTVTVNSTLIGEYNVSNILLVLGGLRAQGFSLEDAANVASRLTPVPGRLEPVLFDSPNAPKVVVDYAHTPDALEKVLQALRPVAEGRNGRLWCVFGCGGNRDASKRPKMGGIAARLADCTIITSDNPRLESPATILAQVTEGAKQEQLTLKNITVIEDRSAAIAHAIAHASSYDIILLAGKGHEDYQDIGGVKRPFSDFIAAQAALKNRLEATSS